MSVRTRCPVALSVVLSPPPAYELASCAGGSDSPASGDVVATVLPEVDVVPASGDVVPIVLPEVEGAGAASPPPDSIEAVPDDEADVPVEVERPEPAENA